MAFADTSNLIILNEAIITELLVEMKKLQFKKY